MVDKFLQQEDNVKTSTNAQEYYLAEITSHCAIGCQDLQELLCINYIPVDVIKFLIPHFRSTNSFSE